MRVMVDKKGGFDFCSFAGNFHHFGGPYIFVMILILQMIKVAKKQVLDTAM